MEIFSRFARGKALEIWNVNQPLRFSNPALLLQPAIGDWADLPIQKIFLSGKSHFNSIASFITCKA